MATEISRSITMNKIFIETLEFSEWVRTYLSDGDLAAVQRELMADPERGDVMQGCGGGQGGSARPTPASPLGGSMSPTPSSRTGPAGSHSTGWVFCTCAALGPIRRSRSRHSGCIDANNPTLSKLLQGSEALDRKMQSGMHGLLCQPLSASPHLCYVAE